MAFGPALFSASTTSLGRRETVATQNQHPFETRLSCLYLSSRESSATADKPDSLTQGHIPTTRVLARRQMPGAIRVPQTKRK